MTDDDLQRADDSRYADLSREVRANTVELRSIRDMLISEPEASPLGRALVKRADTNRDAVQDLRDDFQPVYDWWQQSKGAYRVLTSAAVVLSIIGAAFGIAAYFR